MRILVPALVLFFFILFFSSCVPSQKLYYFYDKMPGKDSLDTTKQISAQKIQRNDRVNITVSSTDPALTAYLNPFNIQSSATSAQQSNNGYLVNSAGTFEFPLLGTLEIAGLSTVDAAALIKEKLSVFYKDLFVNVNLRGQVYFMSGRVGVPIQIVNERLTIFEAIAQSGAQDPYDKKNEVWLVRETNRERLYIKLDLNSKNIFQSPYYYLLNNDLIYMQPGKFTSFLSPNSPGKNILTIAAAALSILIALRTL